MLPYEKNTDISQTIYLLPPRSIGPVRFVGIFAILFGLTFAGFACFWIIGALGFFMAVPNFVPVQIFFVLFGIPFVIAGLAVLRRGLLILLPTRYTIRITDKQLIVREHASFIYATDKIDRTSIATLTVNAPSAASREIPGALAGASNGITVNLVGGRKKFIVGGYSRELLEPLSRDIAAVLGQIVPTDVLSAAEPTEPHKPTVTVQIETEADLPRYQFTPRHTQPAGSKIVMAQATDSLTFLLPAMGFRGIALFFLFFSLVWTGISSILFIAFLAGGLNNPRGIMAILVPAGFIPIGLLMLASAIQMAFAKSVLIATPDRFVFSLTGPFRKKELEAATTDILSIAPGPSGSKINNKPVLQLAIRCANANHLGILTGRREDELEWLATLLTDFYKPSRQNS